MTLSIFSQFPVSTYARAGEDVIAAQYFPQPYDGFYVDAGCYHPVNYSNTYLLYQMGWRGLCIDANPQFAPLYAEMRPRDVFHNSGVAPQAGTLPFYRIEDELSSSTFIKAQAELLKQRAGRIVSEVPVAVRPLNDILAEHQVGRIDALNIDIEFLDEAVILDFDFNRWQPRLIMIEDLTFLPHRPQESVIFQWLTGLGYMFVARCIHTSIFIAPVNDAERRQLARQRGEV